MIIGGLQKTTLIDYPGKVAATVFLAGCNLRCSWCYSSELVLPEKIEKQPKISQKELFDFLKERKGLLDGVVICGGEPTINKNLPEFIKKIRKMGFLVKLDTNGSNSEMLEKLINQKLINYVALDIKSPDIKDIQKSIDILKQGKVDFEFRTTVVPGILTKENIIEITKIIGGQNIKYYLQNFRAEKTLDPSFGNLKPYPISYLEEIKKEIESSFKFCKIR
jgi:pyruvate formate lyase activating enzyme